MHVLVYHTITDAKKWEQVTQNMKTKLEQGQLPEGLKARMFLPSVDGKKAVCLWEAGSLEAVRNFIEADTARAARNEYIAINTDGALGLTEAVAAHTTA